MQSTKYTAKDAFKVYTMHVELLLRKHEFEYPVGEQTPQKHKLLSNTSEVFAQTPAKPNCNFLLVCVMLPYVLISLPLEPVTAVVLVVVAVGSSDGSSRSSASYYWKCCEAYVM